MIDKLRFKIIKLLRRFGYLYPQRLRYDQWNKYFYLKDLYDRIYNIKGDVVECGVAYADSLITFGILAKREGKDRLVYGFDSFEGFPAPSKDDNCFRNPKKGEFGDATLKLVQKQISKAGIPTPILVKGFFVDTLSKYNGGIALLHIDVDLYQSYKDVLDILYKKVVSGGIIAFDEYGEEKWPGATKAIDEFLKLHNLELNKDPHINRYYVIKP